MADKTGISWTDATWNPIVGCSVVSPGCTNCYAMRDAARIVRCSEGAGRASHYEGTIEPSKAGPVWTGKVALAPDHIVAKPLSWRRPRRIFVNSMGDLFHESVPDEWIDRVFAIMALAPQHQFQILTKRARRMREYLSGDALRRVARAANRIRTVDGLIGWPLPNVWLGVTAEDQTRANERVPDLLETPAAVRFVSCEPMLGPVDLMAVDINGDAEMNCLSPLSWREIWGNEWSPEATGVTLREAIEGYTESGGVYPPTDERPPGLDWVICGGESGPGARPMHPDWARGLRDQCAAAGVPFHFKQWGEWGHESNHTMPPERFFTLAGEMAPGLWHIWLDTFASMKIGKRRAGRLLDGVEHLEFPGARMGDMGDIYNAMREARR